MSLLGCSSKIYSRYLKQKEEGIASGEREERKSINESITTLNQRKTLLENTITEMMKHSDQLAFEAEKKTKFKLLSKSNMLKRAANEKQAELNQCFLKKRLLEEIKTHW